MSLIALIDLACFALTAWVAYAAGWQPNELCWGLWVTSLLCGWLTIAVAVIRTILHVTGFQPLPDASLVDNSPLGGFTRRKIAPKAQDLTDLIPADWRGPVLGLGAVLLGLFVTFHFTMFHGIHGALMSVFVQMEPARLFGPNGFINADFGAVLNYLLAAYWPMVVGTMLSRHAQILGGNPGANLRRIYHGVLRMHVFIILAALLGAVGAWYGRELTTRSSSACCSSSSSSPGNRHSARLCSGRTEIARAQKGTGYFLIGSLSPFALLTSCRP